MKMFGQSVSSNNKASLSKKSRSRNSRNSSSSENRSSNAEEFDHHDVIENGSHLKVIIEDMLADSAADAAAAAAAVSSGYDGDDQDDDADIDGSSMTDANSCAAYSISSTASILKRTMWNSLPCCRSITTVQLVTVMLIFVGVLGGSLLLGIGLNNAKENQLDEFDEMGEEVLQEVTMMLDNVLEELMVVHDW